LNELFISDAVAATGGAAGGSQSPMSLILMLAVFGLIFTS
jgi:preprotein translocase subunit YajC